MTPEGKVKSLLKKKMEAAFGESAYRFAPVQNGMGTPGLDVYYCVRGFFVAFETKAPGKHLTPRQNITANEIRLGGGFVARVCDAAEIDKAITAVDHWTRAGRGVNGLLLE